MTKLRTVFILTISFITLSSCGQASKHVDNGVYTVDNSIKKQVDKKGKSFNCVYLSSIDFKMYQNDIVIGDTYTKGKSIHECMTMTTIQGDTINIIGFMGMFAGFGYQIALFKDTCIV